MIFKGSSDEFLQVELIDKNFIYENLREIHTLTVLWFLDEESLILIDDEEFLFKQNEIVCLTEFHTVQLSKIMQVKILRFNRPFYCIIENDSEVGCKGILFYGSAELPFFKIENEELKKFEDAWANLESELGINHELQLEMLQSLLKHFMILSIRTYKKKYNFIQLENSTVDIIRDFNFLVEQYFKTKHTLIEYAKLLNKSSKTISNTFSKLSDKSPLQYIQERRLLEAKRSLRYSNKSIKEISNELGFEDQQTFSRFFKNLTGISPSDFKNNTIGKNCQ